MSRCMLFDQLVALVHHLDVLLVVVFSTNGSAGHVVVGASFWSVPVERFRGDVCVSLGPGSTSENLELESAAMRAVVLRCDLGPWLGFQDISAAKRAAAPRWSCTVRWPW